MPHPEAERLLIEARALARRHGWWLGKAEAADLAAEAVLRGLEHPPPDGQMRPWLSRIVRNLVIDRQRRLALLHSLPPEVLVEPPPAPPTPEDVALARERRTAVRRALRRLPRVARRIILTRYWLEPEGRRSGRGSAPASSAAAAVTFRTRLHRGLASLRRALGGMYGWALPWRLLPAAVNPTVVAVALVLAVPAPPPPPAPATATVHLAQRRPARSHPAPARPTVPVPVPVPVPAPPTATPPSPAPPPAKHPTPPAPQRFAFDDDEVTGTIQAPDDDPLRGRGRDPRRPSLIEIPGSFVPAVVRSFEDL